jgi:hypothetical protein
MLKDVYASDKHNYFKVGQKSTNAMVTLALAMAVSTSFLISFSMSWEEYKDPY